jgi:hypothetical protein
MHEEAGPGNIATQARNGNNGLPVSRPGRDNNASSMLSHAGAGLVDRQSFVLMSRGWTIRHRGFRSKTVRRSPQWSGR